MAKFSAAKMGLSTALHGGSDLDRSFMSRYEKSMRRRVDDGKLPGYTCCLVRRGCLVHMDSYGYADLERKTPFGPDTILRMYCMTKTPIAVGLLMLQEQGKLKLTDPVSKYLPAFAKQGIVANANSINKAKENAASPAKGVTLLRLMTHSAGFGYGGGFGVEEKSPAERAYSLLTGGVERGEISSLEHFCDELARLPLRGPPGKKYSYSLGLDLLSRVIEVVSGKRLDLFLRTAIFDPLGMHDTAFSVPRRKLHRLAGLYACKATAKTLREGPRPLPRSASKLVRVDGARPEDSAWADGRQCPVLSGGGFMGKNSGGLVSTLRDQARFVVMLANGGVFEGRRYLRQETVQKYCMEDLLVLPHVVGERQKAGGKPYGWSALGEVGVEFAKRDPERTAADFEETEVGMGGAATTYWSINPSRELVSLWFSQQIDNESWEKDDEDYWAMARKMVPKKPQGLVKKTSQKMVPKNPRALRQGAKQAGKRR